MFEMEVFLVDAVFTLRFASQYEAEAAMRNLRDAKNVVQLILVKPETSFMLQWTR